MLTRLSIQNYVLIDSLDVSWNEGLTVITGETGAGKSILLGALGLILGDRADNKALLDKKKKCVVEAEFSIGNYGLKKFFYAHELDYEPQTIIRREINAESKSRAFVNDSPVSVTLLRSLGSKLIDIHSQHETLALNQSEFQLSVLDLFAGHAKELEAFREIYHQFSTSRKKLEQLLEEDRNFKSQADYFSYQLNEIDQAQLHPGEQEKTEQELATLENAEAIKSGLAGAIALLSENENSILQQATSMYSVLSGISKFNPEIKTLAERLQTCSIELKDISSDLDSLCESIQPDPQHTALLSERLDLMYTLQRKHNVSTIEALLEVRDSFRQKLSAMQNTEDEISKLKSTLNELQTRLKTSGEKISSNRKKAAVKIESEIRKLLAETGIPHGNLKIEITPIDDRPFDENGIDKAEFLFSANKGVAFESLQRVASGGELSRLMLCIKNMLAKLTAMPTMIFDEIDSGISGEIAIRVGNIIRQISERHQVIMITHLPQMAGKGKNHFLVYKEDHAAIPATRIRRLSEEERISEIAKMIAGNKPSGKAIENAKELLEK